MTLAVNEEVDFVTSSLWGALRRGSSDDGLPRSGLRGSRSAWRAARLRPLRNVHAEVGSEGGKRIHVVESLVFVPEQVSLSREMAVLPVMVLELILPMVDGPVVVLHFRPVVEVRELLDMVRVVVWQVRRVLDRLLVEVHLLDIVLVVKLVVQLGVVAGVFAVTMDSIQRKVLVVREPVARRLMVPVVVIVVGGTLPMLVGHPLLNGQVVEAIISVLANRVVHRLGMTCLIMRPFVGRSSVVGRLVMHDRL
mmetsp:Transcript_8478/g.10406  ORF Transcript_8478/g.10406 Transcript_8478/m.10406 type:complete len:251 (-) Transcript_8478:3592-4344(-)